MTLLVRIVTLIWHIFNIKTFSIKTLSIKTLNKKSLTIKTLSIKTLNIKTLSIKTLSIKTLRHNDTQKNYIQHNNTQYSDNKFNYTYTIEYVSPLYTQFKVILSSVILPSVVFCFNIYLHLQNQHVIIWNSEMVKIYALKNNRFYVHCHWYQSNGIISHAVQLVQYCLALV